MKNKDIDILALQETWINNTDMWKREGFTWYLSSGVSQEDKGYRKFSTHIQRVREGRMSEGLEKHGVGIVVQNIVKQKQLNK